MTWKDEARNIVNEYNTKLGVSKAQEEAMKAIISSLRSTVGENIRVFRSEIPFSVRAAECSLSGESIFSHDRNGKVAAAYEALTKEVTELEERAKNRSGPDRVR